MGMIKVSRLFCQLLLCFGFVTLWLVASLVGAFKILTMNFAFLSFVCRSQCKTFLCHALFCAMF